MPDERVLDASPGDMAIAALASDFVRTHPREAARNLEGVDAADVAGLLARQPADDAQRVAGELAPSLAAEVLHELPAPSAAEVVAAMDPVRAVAILSWMDDTERDALLTRIEPALAKELREMAEYPPETAGRLMDPHVLGFRSGTTAAEALARLRTVRHRRVVDVFLTDDDGQLLGAVPLQVLAVAEDEEPLDNLATTPVWVEAVATQDEVVERFTDRRLTSLPVVDFEGRLIGVIRQDTLASTAQEEAASDMQAMVGASRQERALSPVMFAVRKRLPWLEINLVTAFLAAAVVGMFESTIARFTALAVLMPVVAGQSGNTGAQALAVTMRGLALREVRLRHWPRIARKEAGVALLNGVAVALTTSLGVFVWSRSTGLATVIGSSMVLSMLAAGLAGVTVPMVLTALRQDPAQSSSIILTTVTDVVGFASFLGIATALSSLL